LTGNRLPSSTMAKKPQLPRDDDQVGTMDYIGPALPAILREAADTGLYRYCRSRMLDPDSHALYSDCSKANVLYDHITFVARELVDLVAAADRRVRWQFSDNKRATEIICEPGHAFRIKRVKANRGGLSTGVRTDRLLDIKSRHRPVLLPGQLVLSFGSDPVPTRMEDRTWLTLGFDLDDVEESFSGVFLGVEMPTRFLWRIPLPEAEPEILARLSAPLADRIVELREARSA
jgi:hypothetical protein